jgi:hypothetical protein
LGFNLKKSGILCVSIISDTALLLEMNRQQQINFLTGVIVQLHDLQKSMTEMSLLD